MSKLEGKSSSEWKAAFDRTGILTGATKNGGDEHVAYCPACEDPDESSSASASFNFKTGNFFCHSCQKTYKLRELLSIAQSDASMRAKDKDEKKSSAGGAKQKKSSGEDEPLPDDRQIKQWASDLFRYKDALRAFKERRGLTDETIARFNIGYHSEKRRFTIPVYDRHGELKNVRYYSTRKNSNAKMINHTGHGESRLFLQDALLENELLLVEGEMDALIARQYGFNAMTWTSGVSSWQDKWSGLFENKTVFICFDDDDRGRQSARKTALKLTRAGATCHIVQLSIDGVKGGDLTDYFHKLGNVARDFEELMEESRHTVAGRVSLRKNRERGESTMVSVEDSFDGSHGSRPLKMIGTIHGKASAPFILPKQVEFTCDQDWGDKCKKCLLAVHDGNRTVEISSDDPAIMNMVEKSDEQIDRHLLKTNGIPPTCPRVQMDQDSKWTVEEIMVMPSIEDRSEEIVNPVERTIYNVGSHKLQINKTYEIEGFSMAHPKDARAAFQSWRCDPVEVDIERFRMTPEIKKQLEIFQPDDWDEQTAWQKLMQIAYDLSINVTHIYGRPELHIGYDLVWHSVNSFFFGGQLQVRGWTECLVIGDTRTGKSEVSHRLADHYRSGVIKMADAPSLAGLIGGASQKGSSKAWGITWGVIPLNDKRLVVLDEAGGIKQEIISAMSSVRSQGVAEIVKMGGQRTSARTRLVWICNPVTNRPISEMANGAMDEVQEFIQTPEDVARFDFAMAAASDDVSTYRIDRERKAKTPHIHHSEDCKLLITWAWSRKPEDVVWIEDAEEYIFKKSREYASTYVEDLPLIQKQSFHIKLARLAVAVAARLFSTDETGEKVIVGPEHVDTALRFLDSVYGMNSFGYKTYSSRVLAERLRARRNERRTVELIWADDGIRNTLLRVMNHGKFKNRDFEERGGMARDQAAMAVDELIDYGMLRSMSRGDLKMNPTLLDILRKIRMKVDDELNEEAMEEA